ncbi:MAG: hypothetical protein KatS3mg105_2613 [Gemmatales bacterium]|nr:MAG: hypothetical protein KatS3mg105_2613 [Gemmatales bacterium]
MNSDRRPRQRVLMKSACTICRSALPHRRSRPICLRVLLPARACTSFLDEGGADFSGNNLIDGNTGILVLTNFARRASEFQPDRRQRGGHRQSKRPDVRCREQLVGFQRRAKWGGERYGNESFSNSLAGLDPDGDAGCDQAGEEIDIDHHGRLADEQSRRRHFGRRAF